MELTREQTIKALEAHGDNSCDDCPLHERENCIEKILRNALHYLKGKEPAPSANGTSPQKKSIYAYDSTETLICQALRIGALSAEVGAKAEYKDGVFVVEPGVGDDNA